MKIRKEFKELADMFHTPPAMITDYCGVSPMRIETLLRIRGQMRGGESIKDAIIRNYGESTFKKCDALLGVCPFENETKGSGDESNLPEPPRPTHMIYPGGKPVSLNDRIHELLEMSEYFKETDKVLAWQLRQTVNRILDWLAYEQSQRGALLLTTSSIGFTHDGETGGASQRSPNGEREARRRA